MRKKLLLLAPAAITIAVPLVSVVIGIPKSHATLLFMLAVPATILISYFLLGNREIKSSLYGVIISFFLASSSVGIIYAIRPGEFSLPDFSLFYFLSLVAIALTTSVFEEFIFRGGVLGLLLKYVKGIPVVSLLVIQAILFSASHFGRGKTFIFFVTTFAAGVFFGWVTIKTKSLWFSLGFHFGWDLAITFLTGFHSRNLGHMKAVVVFNSNYASVNDFVFLFATGLCFLGLKKFRDYSNNGTGNAALG
jgi:membrane protease YdiL (CAAX protease family)